MSSAVSAQRALSDDRSSIDRAYSVVSDVSFGVVSLFFFVRVTVVSIWLSESGGVVALCGSLVVRSIFALSSWRTV